MIRFELRKAGIAASIAGLAVLAGCTAKAPPAPRAAAPAPKAEIIPYRPLPPSGATYVMTMPPRGPDGRHRTILSGISDDERVWYFRSAWNVAALNCIGTEFDPILQGYKSFLTGNARTLRAVNGRIDAVYRGRSANAGAAIKTREKVMTNVYNFFALPPARGEFCQAALRVAGIAKAMPKPDAMGLASANFALWEAPFENFFNAYEQYQRDSAVWDATYGARYGASQPGYVAVQRARGSGAPLAGQSNPASTTLAPVAQTGVVIDQDTGAKIPVVPVNPQGQAVPVVQPVAKPVKKP